MCIQARALWIVPVLLPTWISKYPGFSQVSVDTMHPSNRLELYNKNQKIIDAQPPSSQKTRIFASAITLHKKPWIFRGNQRSEACCLCRLMWCISPTNFSHHWPGGNPWTIGICCLTCKVPFVFEGLNFGPAENKTYPYHKRQGVKTARDMVLSHT